jgi:hypothetical protein
MAVLSNVQFLFNLQNTTHGICPNKMFV